MGAAFFGTRSPPWLSYSGTFGVELFFVLSGYLIGTLLLEIIERGPSWQAWSRFMVRRWMRTLPLYFLWLAILAVFWRPLNTPWAHYAAYTFFLQNWAWHMPADNWFGVSWSLAIEEWFYLLFSVTLIGAALLVARKQAVWLALGLFLCIPFACRLVAQHAFGLEDPSKITLLRLDAIAYGVALARLQWENRRLFHYPGLCLCAGIGLILCTWTQMYWNWLPLPGGLFSSIFLNAISIGFCLCIPAAIRLRDRIRLARPAGPAIERAVLRNLHHPFNNSRGHCLRSCRAPAIAHIRYRTDDHHSADPCGAVLPLY